MIKHYMAFIHGADGFLCDIVAATTLRTLQALIDGRGIAKGETVKFNREWLD